MKNAVILMLLLFVTSAFSQMSTTFDGKVAYVYTTIHGKIFARRSGDNKWHKITSKGLSGGRILDISAVWNPQEKRTFVYALMSNGKILARRSVRKNDKAGSNRWNKLTSKGLPSSRVISIVTTYTKKEKKVFCYATLANGRVYARKSMENWHPISTKGLPK